LSAKDLCRNLPRIRLAWAMRADCVPLPQYLSDPIPTQYDGFLGPVLRFQRPFQRRYCSVDLVQGLGGASTGTRQPGFTPIIGIVQTSQRPVERIDKRRAWCL